MLSINGYTYHLGERALFDNISFFVGPGEKIALAGINGSGKTTLLGKIAGTPRPKEIALAGNCRIGYLPQHLPWQSEKTVLDEVLSSQEELSGLEEELEFYNNQLVTLTDYESAEYTKAIEKVSELSEKLGTVNPHEIEAKAEKVLKGLGFTDEDISKPCSTFSGGWKMRISLAQILLEDPDLLMLDEPTNHLDINSVVWLERYLKDFRGAIILISHDRRFLDNITSRTIEIVKGKAYDYPFTYSKYLVEREIRNEQQLATQRNQEKEIERTKQLIDRFKAKATKASMAKSLEKKLDRMDVIEVDDFNQKSIAGKFLYSKDPGKIALRVESLAKSFGDKTIFNDISFEIERGDKVALVGKNGVGKSTILKIACGALKEDGGECKWGHNAEVQYFSQDGPDLIPKNRTPLEHMELFAPNDQFTMCRTILGSFLFSGDDVDKKVTVLSGGERTRLVLAQLAINPSNILVLDEPTNHLDIPSKDHLKDALRSYPGTVIVVSHDREFLAGWCNKVIELREGESKEFPGDIDAFLKEKEKEDLTAYSMTEKSVKAKKEPKPKVDQKPKANSDSREKVKLEKEIEKVEAELGILTKKLDEVKPGKEQDEILSKYGELDSKLNVLMEKWADM
ncbi:ABC-F family ATP-binding cassette domain-containing protein [Luteibaculum oceani]|uniref:ATP-binding cassette domain-containing protein n=1 Tax=Luteibaculum oceani TaxID=1294296 RepID=A0A5C6V4X8_9FLAO|nr:ABC-F family ATP-binding cassette domain-containing protein [Luteibaculum oceani]TXC78848.1 ATP-binding cassette domain-containing protein [Luteibaculum oceani]